MAITKAQIFSRSVAAALALTCCLPRVAWSQDAGADTAPNGQPKPAQDLGNQNDRPWARSTPHAEQKLATEMFREGNSLLKESLYVQAAAKYREALQHWNHPGIHYNLALALLNLDQPVEVIAQLDEAMKYGAAPLDADKFEHAGRYRSLIEKQLARVTVTCDTVGAVVTMDGQPLFTGPGKWENLVRIGQHSFVAQKTGYVTTTKTPMLPPGQKTTIDLRVFTDDEMTVYKRRWTNALPWTVFGAGVVLAGVGGIMHWQASVKYHDYDKGIEACGVNNSGCVPMGSLKDKKTMGDGLQAGAFVGYSVGGAVIVVGAVLAYLNRARPTRINPGSDSGSKLTFSPTFAPGGGGFVSQFHF